MAPRRTPEIDFVFDVPEVPFCRAEISGLRKMNLSVPVDSDRVDKTR